MNPNIFKNENGEIIKMYFNRKDLDKLPELPQKLQILECYGNNLTTLPDLPQGLCELTCRANSLTELPKLPQSLKKIDCHNNKITTMPELPEGLQYLDCSWNRINTIIPFLKCNSSTFNKINYSYNPIAYIPEFTLKSIRVFIAKAPTIKNIYEYIKNDNILDKNLIYRFIGDIEEELLQCIFSRIEEHLQRDEIKRIINQEMKYINTNTECKYFFAGNLTHLINCLALFYDEMSEYRQNKCYFCYKQPRYQELK